MTGLSAWNKYHEYFSNIKKDYCNPLISNAGNFSFQFRKAVKIPRLLTSLYLIAGSLKGMFSPRRFIVHHLDDTALEAPNKDTAN